MVRFHSFVTIAQSSLLLLPCKVHHKINQECHNGVAAILGTIIHLQILSEINWGGVSHIQFRVYRKWCS